MRVIKGGKLLDAKKSVRLAIAGSASRELLLKTIVKDLRYEAREAERTGPKRQPRAGMR
jgi:hypothetical protein